MDALTADYKLMHLREIVMKRCNDRISSGEKYIPPPTSNILKNKWI
jgi:hypothetical protein